MTEVAATVAAGLGVELAERLIGGEFGHGGDSRMDLAHLAFWTEASRQPSAPWVSECASERIDAGAAAAMAALIAGSVLTFAVVARPASLGWALEAAERILAPHWRRST